MRRLILGPPGTGKTTYLINIMEEEIGRGVDPRRIAFLSFTRKAAQEARDRAQAAFGFSKADLPYFRTLHSLAFHRLGLRKDDVFGPKNLVEIGDLLGLSFSTRQSQVEEGLPTGVHRGDRYLFLDGYARARRLSADDAWRTLTDTEELNLWEFERFRLTLEKFKRVRHLVDFADMLDLCPPLDADVVILDEAQDCSTAQWEMFWRVLGSAKRIYVAGDDDQAIYAWAGADIHGFQRLQGFDIHRLSKSHRVSKSIHRLADGIVRRISSRYDKDYLPSEEEGMVKFHRQPECVDITSGEWMLLARNSYHLSQLVEMAKYQGVPYTVRGVSGVNGKHIKAVLAWEKRRRGQILSLEEEGAISEFLPRDRDPDRNLIWHEALTRIPLAEREAYISMLKRGESLTKPPRVNINTIHAVKGGEVDNVLLLTDMTYRTAEGYAVNPDNEHRVFYVGVTRAKKSLHIIEPQENAGYPM